MKHLINVFISFPPLHRTKQKIRLPELWCPLLLKVCISWKDKVEMYRIKAAGGEWTLFFGGPKGLPRRQQFVSTSRCSHVDKQFCMYVKTTSSGVRPRIGSSWGPCPRGPQVSIVRAPGDGPYPRRPLGSSIKEVDDCWYTTTSDMPKGHNTCKWLTVSSTELCGKSCLTDFCKVHLVRLCKGSRTQPCRGCGVGDTNKQQLCCQCGYRSEWRCATRAMRKEFARLAAIKISI